MQSWISRQAPLSDTLEYEGNRRRDFWDVMAGRAARGEDYGRYALEARSAWLDKIARWVR